MVPASETPEPSWVAKQLAKFIGSPLQRWLTAILPIALAALLRFISPHNVICCFGGACEVGAGCDSSTRWLVAIWLTLAAVVASLLYLLFRSDEGQKREQTAALERRERALAEREQQLTERVDQGFRSITMMPNLPVLVKEYGDLYRSVQELSQPYEVRTVVVDVSKLRDPEVQLRLTAEHIVQALGFVAFMTRTFGLAIGGDNTKTRSINANIMLPFRRDELYLLPQAYKAQLVLPGDDRGDGAPSRSEKGLLRFAEQSVDTSTLDWLLVLRSDLIAAAPAEGGAELTDAPPGAPPPYGDFCLPVRTYPESQLLPGAPTALVKGHISVYRDASTLPADYKDRLPDYIHNELQHYFGKGDDDGETRVRSFISVRLGHTDDDPIGVLSLDSDQVDIIGTIADQSNAFLALLVPMLAALSPMVEYYGKVWRQCLALEHDTSGGSGPTVRGSGSSTNIEPV